MVFTASPPGSVLDQSSCHCSPQQDTSVFCISKSAHFIAFITDSLDFIQNSIEEINTFLDKNQNEKTMNISVKKKMEDIFNFYFQFEDGVG